MPSIRDHGHAADEGRQLKLRSDTMRPVLYFSYSGLLGYHAAEQIHAGCVGLYNDDASTFWSSLIRTGEPWFLKNDDGLSRAAYAVVILTAEGMGSHWQAYEAGHLRGRKVPTTYLMLNVDGKSLGSTAYNHLNCSEMKVEVLEAILRTGGPARSHDDLQFGLEVAMHAGELQHRLSSLVAATEYLAGHREITSLRSALLSNDYVGRAVNAMHAAGVGAPDIAHWLSIEQVDAAVSFPFLEALDLRDGVNPRNGEHDFPSKP